jgi:hypothetical protein
MVSSLYQFGGAAPSRENAVGHVPQAKRSIIPGAAYVQRQSMVTRFAASRPGPYGRRQVT